MSPTPAQPLCRRSPRAAASRAAFTFIELMCVLAVLGIASALVVPLMNNTADVRLAAAQRKVLADLQYAQGLAVAGRHSVYVRCAADRYEVCTLVGSTLTPVPHPIDAGKYVVRFGATATDRALRGVTLALPTFGSGDRTLAFDATGVPFTFNELTAARSSLASRSELRLGASGVTRSVYVEAFTGELHVP